MNHAKIRISLDVQARGSSVVVNAKQGDTGRMLVISLTDGGLPYRLTSDCYAVFTADKPDGHKVFNECQIEGNTIVYPVKYQTVAAEGRVNCEVRVYGQDSMLLTSARFVMVVEGTVYTEGDEIESDDDFSVLTDLISKVQTTIPELERLKKETEEIIANGTGPAGKDGKDGVDGKDGQDGKDGATAEEVLEAMPKLTGLDFSDFEKGSFAEILDGVPYYHTVSFDSEGRPTQIDGIAIRWDSTPVREPVAALYNGIRMPILPDVAYSYPYRFIVDMPESGIYQYQLVCFDKLGYFGVSEFMGREFLKYFFPSDALAVQLYIFDHDLNRWDYYPTLESPEHLESIPVSFPPDIPTNQTVWASVDLVNEDGSRYISGSDPVPVYE